jgi:general secretion pathway protein A
MYTAHFGLRDRPFELTANPRYLFLTPSHREALAAVRYAITSRRGIAVLTGEAGCGKTTVIQAALQGRCATTTVFINNPTLTRSEFVDYLGRAFSLSAEARTSKTAFLFELSAELTRLQASGASVALIVDEAQCLPYELLEEVRFLANMETPTDKLLPVVLVGQPELDDRLNEHELRQLKQRIAVRTALQPLSAGETAAYIDGRVRIAGGRGPSLFAPDAMSEIHLHARGIPRTISVISDNALVAAFARGAARVTRDIVRDVCADFDLRRTVSLSATDAIGGTALH